MCKWLCITLPGFRTCVHVQGHLRHWNKQDSILLQILQEDLPIVIPGLLHCWVAQEGDHHLPCHSLHIEVGRQNLDTAAKKNERLSPKEEVHRGIGGDSGLDLRALSVFSKVHGGGWFKQCDSIIT